MNKSLLLVALLATSAPLIAQNTTSTSGSGAEANSGSISGAQSNNTANNNAGIGSSENTNTTNSNANAVSGSVSGASSNGNEQGQSQGQSANNTQGQGQDQGQMQAQSNDANNSSTNAATNNTAQTNMQGQQATNEQGVTVNQTWNTRNRRETEVRTNNAVPLASSSSFSSDYCGGSVSGGGSSAPLGISLGMAVPKFDKSCQSLRRAEKFGMAAVNAINMGQPELGGRLMSMMIWTICTSDSGGPEARRSTADACDKLQLLGAISHASSQPAPAAAPEPRMARNGKVTPEAASRALASNEVSKEAAAIPPR